MLLNQQTKLIDNMDAVKTWLSPGNALSVDMYDKAEGTASLKSAGSNPTRFQNSFAVPFSMGFSAGEAYLCFSLYISDVNSVTGVGQLEISSSGKNDQNELFWGFSALGLKNGWNRVALKVSAGSSTGGAIDFTKINFMRLYIFAKNGASTTFRLDNMRFSNFAD